MKTSLRDELKMKITASALGMPGAHACAGEPIGSQRFVLTRASGQGGRDINHAMILEFASDALKVGNWRNAERFQFARRAYTRPEQQCWRAYRPCRKNDFLARYCGQTTAAGD